MVIWLLALPLVAVDFQRDVRPILSDKCFSCHGPNAAKRAMPLKAGDPEASELYKRVVTADDKKRMPPQWAGHARLSDKEAGVIKDWIAGGADWPKHWAFTPPVKSSATGVDAIVQARLAREGLAMSPEAERGKLIRRVSFDLTGLPPTVAELNSSEPYERAVDRLLASPRYGERMAARWLDAARYADTNGYQTDAERYMWRWRDWVIASFNRNQPFDEFIRDQIAGDLVPNSTLDQKIATGFNRNHRGNGEGGIIPEEYAVEYVVDRVETMSTVFLGLTVGCARCHDHKYDPISQREFYQLYAFFNSIPERGRANKYGNSPPMVAAPLPEQATKLADLDRAVNDAQRKFQPGAGVKATRGLSPKGDFGFLDSFTFVFTVTPETGEGPLLTKTDDKPEQDGYALFLRGGKLQAEFVQRWLDDALRLESEAVIPVGRATQIVLTYDASRSAEGVRLYLDRKPAAWRVVLDELNQEFKTKHPLRIGEGAGLGRFNGKIEDVSIYDRVLYPEEIAGTGGEGWARLLDARIARDRFAASISTVMVMDDLPQPRPAFILNRGSYDRPTDRVERGTPAALHAWPEGAPPNRLGLAQWITDRRNPLTSRVMVNRVWQMFFGQGLVPTVEDFGAQGEAPSNTELLDWLAAEFVRSGWDMRALVRTIVTSATYRQSSKVTPALTARDPENRLLARGPRIRLAAEMVRDQALSISGLLVERVGGPSVKPYQPAGLWSELSGGKDYEPDHGEALWRRSMYTFWKRASAPPMMMNFDSAGREICVVRETRTNTPLQALNLMNDVTYLEASRKLGERMMREGGVPFAFRLATGRAPSPQELEVLNGAYSRALDRYRTDAAAAEKLLAIGEAPRDRSLDPAKLAASATVASLILNLDEVVTKE